MTQQPLSDVAALSIRLVTALLGVRTSTAVDPDVTPEAENLRAVRAEVVEFGDHVALVGMLGEMMAGTLIAVGRADGDRDPMRIWQTVAVGLARDVDFDE